MDDLLLLSTKTTDSKMFLKAPLAPTYINFEEERMPKKRILFCQIIPKVPKNNFFNPIIQKYASVVENLPKTASF